MIDPPPANRIRCVVEAIGDRGQSIERTDRREREHLPERRPQLYRAGVHVVTYEDETDGTMAKVDGVVRFTEVTLHPKVTIAPGSDPEKARALHERAHAICFIANSVNFPVRNEPTISAGAPV